MNDGLDFEYGEGAKAYRGCGVTFRGEFWYFGGGGQRGSPERRQASKVVGCKLTRQFDLSFDFMQGSCNTFADPEPRVLLCFEAKTPYNECHT